MKQTARCWKWEVNQTISRQIIRDGFARFWTYTYIPRVQMRKERKSVRRDESFGWCRQIERFLNQSDFERERKREWKGGRKRREKVRGKRERESEEKQAVWGSTRAWGIAGGRYSRIHGALWFVLLASVNNFTANLTLNFPPACFSLSLFHPSYLPFLSDNSRRTVLNTRENFRFICPFIPGLALPRMFVRSDN